MAAKFKYVPKWVNLVCTILEFADYRIVGKISNMLSWRAELIERHCVCSQCLKRDPNMESKKWRKST